MPKQQYTPGTPVAVADLEVGDTIYARRNRLTKAPTAPVRIDTVTVSQRGNGLIQLSVIGYNGRWWMGWLNPTRTFPRAVPVEA